MKYPRTYHLPWSEGSTSDDKFMTDLSVLEKTNLVYTEKLDGENTNFSRNYIHARSQDGYGKSWQTDMKRWWDNIRYDLPENLQFCGENLYAIHSIEYSQLTNYFYLFSIFDIEKNIVLSFEEIEEWQELLNVPAAPVIEFGRYHELKIPEQSILGGVCEGYVVRNVDRFSIDDFHLNVAKCVRKNHVQTDVHWTKNWKRAKLN